ncbi:VanZ family protein [Candidatus Omnitrophota bacterium]
MANRIKQERSIFAWTPTFIWASIILIFAVLPCKVCPPLAVGYFDKVAHFCEYAFLAVLIVRNMCRMGSLSVMKISLFTLILSGGYGIVMELIQQFVPGRDASLYDVVANAAGTIFGIILGILLL